jgi:predicted O-methyltransferase YrrM
MILDGNRLNELWLAHPLTIRHVANSSMISVNSVKGFLTSGDIAFLFHLGKDVPAGGRYLEVGSFMGLSSIIVANALIASLNFDARVYCVDTWKGSQEHQDIPEVQTDSLYRTFLNNVTNARVSPFIRPIQMPSASAAEQWREPPLDIVFVDGDHSLDGCYTDISSWLPNLARNGRMLGHDAVPNGGVHKALERIGRELACEFRIHTAGGAHFIWELVP